MRPMSEQAGQLSSVRTSLDELTKRIIDVADGFRGTERDDVAGDLYEVERALLAAARKLDSVVQRMR
jgi:hypothetical protein